MGMFYNEYRQGKGIEKEEKNKKSHIRFLKILYRKVWDLTKLNLLYLVFLIPTFVIIFFLSGIVTNGMFKETSNGYAVLYEIFVRTVIVSFFTVLWGMGPATAGLTTILIKYTKEEHAFVWSDFCESIKTNFKQSLIVFIVDAVALIVLYAGVIFYGNMPGIVGIITFIFIMSVILVYTMMHFYIYPIMVTYNMKLWHIYYNSLIYTLGKLPRTLLTLFILLTIHIGIVYVISNFSIGIVVLLLGVSSAYSISGFIVNFNVYENMKKSN